MALPGEPDPVHYRRQPNPKGVADKQTDECRLRASVQLHATQLEDDGLGDPRHEQREHVPGEAGPIGLSAHQLIR